jgi:chromate transporter
MPNSFAARLAEVVFYFFRLGLIGFGGPMSLIAMMQKDLVEKRGWINGDEFKQAFALIKSMPGPVAFQTAVFLGRRRAGRLGGLLAGTFLLIPAFTMVVVFGMFYDRLNLDPRVQKFMTGMQVAAIVTILFGLKSFFLPYVRRPEYWLILAISGWLFFSGALPEPAIILGGSVLWAFRKKFFSQGSASGAGLSAILIDPKLIELISICAKAGSIVFGTGLAILPILEQDFVNRLHWMTHAEYMDALAIGQVTPGPVMISVTFIGFKTLGWRGAIAGTMAVFGPSLFHMLTWFNSAIAFLSRQKWIQDFVFAATSIIMGTILVATAQIMWPWRETPILFGIFAFVFAIAYKTKWPAWALIPLGGALGLLVL